MQHNEWTTQNTTSSLDLPKQVWTIALHQGPIPYHWRKGMGNMGYGDFLQGQNYGQKCVQFSMENVLL